MQKAILQHGGALSLEQALASVNMPLPTKHLKPSGFTRWGKNNRYWITPKNTGYYFGDMVSGLKGRWLESGRLCAKQSKAKCTKARLAVDSAQREIASSVQALWDTLPAADPSHPYLVRKGIPPLEARQQGVHLVVPLRDESTLWSLQRIDSNGRKLLQAGGRKKGCYCQLGKLGQSRPILFAEGYATAVTLRIITGLPVIMTIDAGNISEVIKKTRRYFPERELIIAADNDQWGEVNTGLIKAQEVAKHFDCMIALPDFSNDIVDMAVSSGMGLPTDWNDLALLASPIEVLAQLAAYIDFEWEADRE